MQRCQVRIDRHGRLLVQTSIWLPVDLMDLVKLERLNLTEFNERHLGVYFGLEPVADEYENQIIAAAQVGVARQQKVIQEREAGRERTLSAVRAMRADREAAQVRQTEIADALQTIVGKKAGQYRRVLLENDPYGDHINEWDALVAGVSRRCGAAVDPAEVAGALRALVAALA